MTSYFNQMPHGSFSEVLPDIFFVQGTMKNEFFGSMWEFGRNMTVVRQDGELTIFNSVRLSDEGLAILESYGTIKNVVRLGDMHGVDDPFYLDRYNAVYWGLEGMGLPEGRTLDKIMKEGGELPLADSSIFIFKTVKRPECILKLERDNGILIACDSLQNWAEPDDFTDQQTIETMSSMNFYQPANLGPAWMHGSEPQKDDFVRLQEVKFEHAFCGHGSPVIGGADKQFQKTISNIFEI